jgi:hypothetical protein
MAKKLPDKPVISMFHNTSKGFLPGSISYRMPCLDEILYESFHIFMSTDGRATPGLMIRRAFQIGIHLAFGETRLGYAQEGKDKGKVVIKQEGSGIASQPLDVMVGGTGIEPVTSTV